MMANSNSVKVAGDRTVPERRGASAHMASAEPMTYLNLGCGPVSPQGWVNVDGSNRAWLASRLPLLDGLLVRLRWAEAREDGR